MNDKTVYAKTPAGQQEIGARKAGLDIRQRRLLILVDGHRSALELRELSGFADAPALIEGLLAQGLVAAADGAAAAAAGPAAAPAAEAAAPVDLVERRQRGTHAVNEMLGPVGKYLAIRVAEAESLEVLEDLIDSGRRMVGDLRGRAAIPHFDRLLAGEG